MGVMSKILSRTQGSQKNVSNKLANLPQEIWVPRVLLIFSVIFLCCIGLVMIYSASSIVALSKFNTPSYYFKRQAVFLAMGALGALVAARVNYQKLSLALVWLAWVITLGALVAVFVAGQSDKGAERWLLIFGVTFQPSEFAKLTILLLLCHLMARFHSGHLSVRGFLGASLICLVFPLILILAQPDLGTTLIILATLLCLLWLGGIPLRVLIVLFLAVGVLATFFVVTSEFRMRRLVTAFDPWLDPQGAGYQQIQGIYALASGGLFGLGLGDSRQKFYLPEAHTDFIFTIIGEELGLIGTLIVIGLFVVLVYAGLQIARKAPDLLGKLIAAGCTSSLAIQAGINLLSVLGAMPVTGKPLPFLSYGGSSIITSLLLVGLIINVSRVSGQLSQHGASAKEQRKALRADKRRASFTLITPSSHKGDKR